MSITKLVPTLARLTLYSGKNCTLCDTAKSELARIRKTRDFELDIVNIHDPGQEHWKKKYVWWIPALHIDGKEVAKGRWDAQTVIDALDSWQTSPKTQEGIKKQLDKQGHPSDYPYSQPPPFYERSTANILGADEEQGSTSDEGLSHCFNCGSAYHVVSSCLVPHNMELITLSRQMYNFFKPVRFPEPMTISAATEFVNQRRQWLASFEPGQVRGSKLREALGLHDDDIGSELPWLKNMADWGYPSGWFSEQDPREQVLQRIDGLFAEPLDLEDGDHSLTIFGEDAVEALDVGIRHYHNSRPEEINNSQYLRDSSVMRLYPTKQVDMERGRRWARYPSTYFSSDLLPIYNGARLPPILPTTSSTFTSERHLLWECILDKVDRCPARALHDLGNVPGHVPPPPTSLPPPLPPHGPVARADDVPKDVESDMELSDSDC